MIGRESRGDRHVVPQWRGVPQSVEAGEFQRLAEPRELSAASQSELRRFENEWEADSSVGLAADFVSAALIAGEFGRADEAARQVLRDSENPVLVRVAGRYQARMANDADFEALSDADLEGLGSHHLHLWVRRQKQRLAADPRNALAWSSLARRYTALGQFEHAEHAIRIALALAPNSRYVLRSAARFYVHVHQADRAFDLLGGSARVRNDPWLHASWLSVGSIAQARIPSLRTARRMLDDQSFRDIEHAELAAELATIELVGGSDKKSRKLFDVSLDAPTGNSLAQAQWASQRIPSLLDRVASSEAPFDAEAKAQRAAQAGNWESALASARGWQSDQPFDDRAAAVGSYIASVGLEDWSQALLFTEIGLRAAPGQPVLLNNKAFALINLGRLDEAEKVLAQAPSAGGGKGPEVTLAATRGLLAFRRGDPTRGRALYLRSIELARHHGDTDAQAMAIAMLLRTEANVGEWRDFSELVPQLRELANSVRDRGTAECVAKAVEIIHPPDTPEGEAP